MIRLVQNKETKIKNSNNTTVLANVIIYQYQQ
jgi:hypothetical protein